MQPFEVPKFYHGPVWLSSLLIVVEVEGRGAFQDTPVTARDRSGNTTATAAAAAGGKTVRGGGGHGVVVDVPADLRRFTPLKSLRVLCCGVGRRRGPPDGKGTRSASMSIR